MNKYRQSTSNSEKVMYALCLVMVVFTIESSI